MNIIKLNEKNIQENDNSSTTLLVPDIQKSQVIPIYNDISLPQNLGIQKRSNREKILEKKKEIRILEKDQNMQQDKKEIKNETRISENDNALSLISQDYGCEDDSDSS